MGANWENVARFYMSKEQIDSYRRMKMELDMLRKENERLRIMVQYNNRSMSLVGNRRA